MISRPWFLEVFSGKAWLTRALRKRGWGILPPIDIVIEGDVLAAADVLDPLLRAKVEAWLKSGCVKFVHFGTPCATFSRARKEGDGGPPPLRADQFLFGVPSLDAVDKEKVRLGTFFMTLTLEWCALITDAGAFWSIENPASSMMWLMPAMVAFVITFQALKFELHMCAYGSKHMKPTLFVTSWAALEAIVRTCPGKTATHVHEPLKGKVKHEGRWVYRTKLAQVYPHELCDNIARTVDVLRQCAIQPAPQPAQAVQATAQLDPEVSPPSSVQADKLEMVYVVSSADPLQLGSSSLDGQQFAKTFTMKVPAHERKRPLGQPCRFREHRRMVSGAKAVRAEYQMKRGLVPPLFTEEVEPGEAVRLALDFVHPFTKEAALPQLLVDNVYAACNDPTGLVLKRESKLAFWKTEAVRLMPASLLVLRAVNDAPLRRLLRGCKDHEVPELGNFFHVELWKAMAKAGNCLDQKLIDEMLTGMSIVGAVQRSGRWPDLPKERDCKEVSHLIDRAWEIREKIKRNILGVPLSGGAKSIWEATIEDRDEGSCMGPFWSDDEISELLGTQDWVPTQRFEVHQKNKVRGCDSATANLVNVVTKVLEKLQLPTTDENVAVLRLLLAKAKGVPLHAWVLDERKAYKQIGIKPDHRGFSVIGFRHFQTGKLAYFVMVGHSFGLVSAVYNYNRRAALLDEVLRKLFALISFNFYDDKFGFET